MFVKVKELRIRLLTWIICAFLCFLIQNLLAADELTGDAAGYWMLGESFWEDGVFTLLNTGGFRGYVFPVFLGICNHYIGKIGWRVVNAVVTGSMFAVIVPGLLCVGGAKGRILSMVN